VVKKGRHRRFEEARALKRSHDVDLNDLFESLNGSESEDGEHKPEHDAWADLAEEWESKNPAPDDVETESAESADDAEQDAEDAEDDAEAGVEAIDD